MLPMGAVLYQRVGRLCMWGWRGHTIYALLKQKPYNTATNTLKACLSTQPPSFSALILIYLPESLVEDS